ncbi:lipoprotein [Pseudomonas oryzihabitans]|uniref:OB-fold protein n=1 Tax=Pseudomonas rhizoryzae TaxID=2571129 RepID=UPI00073705B0|nr:hypothetical protein [Pseudomonas rhizoryzae]KTS73441.1 lipoprotein [Pseudomonas psychrotolerans]KTT04090.1 lipoprotein [Pseudomonas psychrotolerans]KTT23584.1 lipoprotein [Pseudomonas psychrotolerans]KTT28110.1 lipoprotein [Pseudomonas psychrotolerans]KTT37030.1 lipoprotein [Pseudomonas psychrotolerans]
MKRYLPLAFIALLSGCESLDSAMSATNNALGTTGDLLSGDLRPLAAAQPATLTDIWRDWQQNEVAAKDKWSLRTLEIPGIVTRVSATGVIVGQNKLAVIFSDPNNPKCTAQALTRDDLLVNKTAINKLKKGDRITVTGVLDSDPALLNEDQKCWLTIGKAKITARS